MQGFYGGRAVSVMVKVLWCAPLRSLYSDDLLCSQFRFLLSHLHNHGDMYLTYILGLVEIGRRGVFRTGSEISPGHDSYISTSLIKYLDISTSNGNYFWECFSLTKNNAMLSSGWARCHSDVYSLVYAQQPPFTENVP